MIVCADRTELRLDRLVHRFVDGLLHLGVDQRLLRVKLARLQVNVRLEQSVPTAFLICCSISSGVGTLPSS